MFRSFLSIVLIFLISVESARSEDHPEISIEYCLDSSTLILKGRILNEDGNVKIEAVLKGAFPSHQALIRELRDINNYGEYSPKMKVDWEVIIFFKASKQHGIVPVFYWDDDADTSKVLGFAISTLWLKDGSVFYARQGADDELGDWELHANEVIDYFGSLEAYRTNSGYGKLQDTVQQWLYNQ